MLDIRFAESVRCGVLLEVVGDGDVVVVPKDVADEGVDEQFSYIFPLSFIAFARIELNSSSVLASHKAISILLY